MWQDSRKQWIIMIRTLSYKSGIKKSEWFSIESASMVPVAEVSVGGEPPHDGGVLDVHLLEDGLRHVAVLQTGKRG